MSAQERKVIFASSLGTVFEWYDFFVFALLYPFIASEFFASSPPAARNIFALLIFAAGYIVRPFGAIVFGRIGDLVGRKYTFLVTIGMMGLSTFLVGLLPGSNSIGIAAPVLLLVLRMLQGLAVGGEYGGAATYVAEHAPSGRRGFYTSWIQLTATAGLFLTLIVIVVTRDIVGEAAFGAGGMWRITFLLSIVLLVISLWIRFQLNESPAFLQMKADGEGSSSPIRDAFGNWPNLKIGLIALFGLTAGQGVVWYASQFYIYAFMQISLHVSYLTAVNIMAWALVAAAPFFVVFGWLSDKIGRKPIILTGCLLAAVLYFPVFGMIAQVANPALAKAIAGEHYIVTADPADCTSLFDPVGTKIFTHSCDIARRELGLAGAPYDWVAGAPGSAAVLTIGTTNVHAYDARKLDAATQKTVPAAFQQSVAQALRLAGFPANNDAGIVKMASLVDFNGQAVELILLVFVLVFLATMVYGPIGATLVEFFPTRIRYSGMSLPYNIGNGVFGGLLPAAAVALVAASGDIFRGLWYPVIIAGTTFVIGLLFVPETKDRDIYDNNPYN